MSTKRSPFKFGVCLICEDVREEIRNKVSLFGVLGGDILLSNIPTIMKSGIYVEIFSEDPGEKFFALVIKENGKERGRVDCSAVFKGNEPALVAVGGFPLQILEGGDLTVDFLYESRRHRLLKKSVRIGT